MVLNPEDVGSMIINSVKSRLNRYNKNWLCVICGETGSGKSYSAISLASMIGRVFIVFTPLEFLQLLNSGTLRKGDVIVFDEAGVGLSAREWQSVQNKLMGSVLQTFRNLNVAVIFTVPNLSFVDIQVRKLFHMIMETESIDYDNGLAKLRLYNVQVNNRLDFVYYKHPRVRDVNGRVYKVTHMFVPKPDKVLVDYYEDKKREYTKFLNAKALSDLSKDYNMSDVKVKKSKSDVDESLIVETIINNRDEYVKVWKGRRYVDKDLIVVNFGVPEYRARIIQKRVAKELL